MKNGEKGEARKASKPSKSSKLLEKKWLKTTLLVILIAGWVAVSLIGSEFLVVLIAKLLIPTETINSTVLNSSLSTISYLLAVFLIVWVPSKIQKITFVKSTRERLGLNGLPTWTDIGLSPVGYIVMLLIVVGLRGIFQLFPWFDANETQELGYSFYMLGWERAIAFIELVIIAPIMEELIFRGWLYGNLRVRIPKWLAILIVSVLFGVVHMQWNVGVSVFAISVVNCILREVTGTIYAGTLMHMLNNGIAFYLVYIIGMGA